MKKRGFTLIELLAVIVILAIIALIAIPIIMNIIDKANKSAFQDSGYGIIKTGELYYSKHSLKEEGKKIDREFIFPDNYEGLELKGSKPVSGNMIVSKEGKIAIAISNGKYCVRKSYDEDEITIDEDIKTCKTKEVANAILVNEIKIASQSIELAPGSKKTITVEVLPSEATNKNLKWSSSDESIATVQNGEITGIKGGTTKIKVETIDGSNITKEITVNVTQILTSSNNCIKNTSVCANGTKVNVKVNTNENYDFYVIKDTGTQLTLIMDRNIGSRVAWISKEDYIVAGGTEANYGSNGNSNKGPLTVLKALEEITSTWTNISSMTYSLIDDKPDYYGSTVRYQPITRSNVKARMLTYKEASSLGCTRSNNSCPSYLYSNLSSSNTENQSAGYWLSTSDSSKTDSVWYMRYEGAMYRDYVNSVSISMFRPVVTISKSI